MWYRVGCVPVRARVCVGGATALCPWLKTVRCGGTASPHAHACLIALRVSRTRLVTSPHPSWYASTRARTLTRSLLHWPRVCLFVFVPVPSTARPGVHLLCRQCAPRTVALPGVLWGEVGPRQPLPRRAAQRHLLPLRQCRTGRHPPLTAARSVCGPPPALCGRTHMCIQGKHSTLVGTCTWMQTGRLTCTRSLEIGAPETIRAIARARASHPSLFVNPNAPPPAAGSVRTNLQEQFALQRYDPYPSGTRTTQGSHGPTPLLDTESRSRLPSWLCYPVLRAGENASKD